MARFEVIRPWYGVKLGEVVEIGELHPALAANVRRVSEAKLTPSVEQPGEKKAASKAEIVARLKDLGVDFDGRASADVLAGLLPEGDPLKPTE